LFATSNIDRLGGSDNGLANEQLPVTVNNTDGQKPRLRRYKMQTIDSLVKE
jgi:hypothetical protein